MSAEEKCYSEKTICTFYGFPLIAEHSWRHPIHMEVFQLAKRKANHVMNGMNAAKAQGKGAGYNEEFSNEPLTEAQRQNNKKRKTNQ
jgi:small acid-soluble spore protein O (minor)